MSIAESKIFYWVGPRITHLWWKKFYIIRHPNNNGKKIFTCDMILNISDAMTKTFLGKREKTNHKTGTYGNTNCCHIRLFFPRG